MSNCQERVKQEIAIVKMINTFGNGLSQEWKHIIYESVTKWRISDRINEERKNSYRGKYK